MNSDLHPVKTFSVLDSPIGPLTITARDGQVDGLFMDAQRHAPAQDPGWVHDEAPFEELIAQLKAYFAGSEAGFDVPLSLSGTEFQRRVWAELREIPLGETISYGELARRAGTPGASRAVGLANGRNPVSIVVPCHRVIGADGRLTGYGGGLERKAWLLRHEAGMRGAPAAQLFAEPLAAV
jgi:methylated-DNA-[protein]-cysteine S-methyltransferase